MVQSAVVVGVTSVDPVAAMVEPPPVQQQYRDVREGEMPGEGIALAGRFDDAASNLPRARIRSNTGRVRAGFAAHGSTDSRTLQTG